LASTSFYGTGRRKKSVARVYLMPGTGKITINKRDIDDYFGLETLKTVVRQPLVLTDTLGQLRCEGQCSRRRLHRPGRRDSSRNLPCPAARRIPSSDRSLKSAGYLTRDPRMKERKKYGLKKARRAPQFSKR
jgi:small subunit ribosomal protein S9